MRAAAVTGLGRHDGEALMAETGQVARDLTRGAAVVGADERHSRQAGIADGDDRDLALERGRDGRVVGGQRAQDERVDDRVPQQRFAVGAVGRHQQQCVAGRAQLGRDAVQDHDQARVGERVRQPLGEHDADRAGATRVAARPPPGRVRRSRGGERPRARARGSPRRADRDGCRRSTPSSARRRRRWRPCRASGDRQPLRMPLAIPSDYICIVTAMSTSVSIQTVAAGGDVHALALGSAYLGAALGVLMVAPQIARTLRDRGLPGVSRRCPGG